MEHRKSIQLSLNQTVRIKDIANELEGNNPTEVLSELEFGLAKHFYQFGTRPFIIEFNPGKGYILRATSLIGMLSTPQLRIFLNPKFKTLPFGKCLALSQYTGSSLLNIASQELTKNLISDKYEYSTLDFLGYGLIDAINSIVNNGFARTFKEVIGQSSKLKGSLALYETFASGQGLLNPVIVDSEPNLDIYPNRLLKSALQKLIDETTNIELRSAAQVYLAAFDEVNTLSAVTREFEDFFFNLPRADYEKGMLYANNILNGGGISESGVDLDIPSITLDFDLVFESYVTKTISKLFHPEKFSVSSQYEISHPTIPVIPNKFIKPDIVVENKNTGVKFIIDTKNKYTELTDSGVINLNNADIYQITYYCRSFGSKYAFLVYPGENPKLQFPLRSSESESAFKTKCESFIVKYREQQCFKIFEDNSVFLFIYHIDLSGSIYNTEKSVASFCQFLSYLSENEIKN